ncbi:PREDICTED: probable U3 small nucleolar RNA-associated protein 11 [Dufourea novaeangliae]|uniref:U3 small nucleolar RNA-associated protein 11 n=1 Tax=Dufourea novaeangliae TaxID=178035 RepID=A0A154P8E9_DUFNO|nr:PREDICTED: probable U3 small nucleolar RNA-associated protein 11 [Dufourea novaeangliae]XP_015429176.1 PREDICTED: probable U3 small nucleolar RNA-associated protein 11 [Dufourea novaeangliae]KZC07488.1 putative U3 small nucleolar RNA-associated protein 11 [Dufourea novaeangliae]
MSSWKKAAKATQKTHRERHQPEARKHLGLLEKKKDYIARARDYQEKQQTLKLLRKRALNKNPDEFYFHMINSKIENGVHREKNKNDTSTFEQIQLMETQDMRYVAHKRTIEAKKIDKLQSQLHMIDVANETPNKHTFFVDSSEEAKNFDLAKRLDTHPALLSRRTNRPKLSRLKDMKLPDIDEKTLNKIEQQKHMAYMELQKRINREQELTIVQQKLEMQKALKDKKVTKPKLISKGTKNSAPLYKWKYERKR